MDISISAGLYYKKGYKEVLDIIAETSCKNIELLLNQSFIEADDYEIKGELHKRDLTVKSIHNTFAPFAYKRGESEKLWINKSIDLARILGAGLIVSHMVKKPYFDNRVKDVDALHRDTILSFKDLKGIYVTTENVPNGKSDSFLSKPSELYDFISRNNVPLTFDTSHCARIDKPIIDYYMTFKDYIKNIHISDFHQGVEHKTLGDGSLPLKEFLHVLKRENYNGLLTIELDYDNPERNKIESNEEAVAALQRSVDFIKENFK